MGVCGGGGSPPHRGKGWSHLMPPFVGTLPDPQQLSPPCHLLKLTQVDDMYVSAWKPHGARLTSSPPHTQCFPHSAAGKYLSDE